MTESRIYGVSTGDGNNGVSHMFADYYVRTDAPWRLAELAALAQFKPGSGMAWAQRHVEIDGEADYTIAAVFDAPPCEDTEDGEYPEVEGDEEAEDGRNWSEHNGAWLIIEISPESDPRDGVTVYDSLEGAFSAPELALCPAEEVTT